MSKRLFIGGSVDDTYVEVREDSVAWEVPVGPTLTADPRSNVSYYAEASTELFVGRTIKLAVSDRKALRLRVYVESHLSDDLDDEAILRRMLRPDLIVGEIDRMEYLYG